MHTAISVKHCYVSQQNIQLKKLLIITVGKYAENITNREQIAWVLCI